jgi:hypothetical protein
MGSGVPGARDGYADASLRPAGGDWEKYHYTYRVFGRLLYNPDADPNSWRCFLRREFGAAASAAEAALANASRILPLVTTAYHPSASNNRYWPELYTNMPIVTETRPHPYGDTPSPKRFGTVSSLDPELFSCVDEFAAEVVNGQRSGKYSPLDVARWLDGCAQAAARHLAEAEAQIADRNDPSFRRWAVDVAIQSGLGRFFAQKLRAGVAYALYARTGDVDAIRDAIEAYRAARTAWAEAAERAQGIYRDDLTFGREAFLRGHWADRLSAIDQDIADMEAVWEEVAAAGRPTKDEGQRTKEFALEREVTPARCDHTPPESFRPGEPLEIDVTLREVEAGAMPIAVRLHYRHVNQAERYRVMELERAGERYRATIPGEYTDSAYPLQYFFELRDAHGRAWLYPGFAADLSNQPYLVVRRASTA